MPAERVPAVPAVLDGPGVGVSDPRELLLGYLDRYREALMRKLAWLSDTQLRAPVAPLGWSPLKTPAQAPSLGRILFHLLQAVPLDDNDKPIYAIRNLHAARMRSTAY